MKKLVFALSAMLGLVTYQANAQASNIGVHLSTAFPMGDFGEFTNFGIGGGLTYDYYFNDNFNLGIEGEFLNFAYDSEFLDGESFNLVPILLTGAYHTDFGNELDFYGGLGAGIFLKSSSVEGSESESDFGISPRIGVAYELGDRLFLDVSVRYGLIFDATDEGGVSTDNTSFLGANIGILYTIME